MTNRKLDYLLAFYCSPALAGIKSGNLFSVKTEDSTHTEELFCDYNKCLNPMGITLEVLCKCETHLLVFVYRQSLLWQELLDEETQSFLRQYGYTDWSSLNTVLAHLKVRLRECYFPHEIGLFLSYPLEDVIGFIENKGRDCKLCGCWKVYSDKEAAQARFEKFILCRNDFCQRIRNGTSILQLFHVA